MTKEEIIKPENLVYKKLHQLDKDCRAAYVDKHFEIIFCYKVGDDGCNSQYHK